MISSTCVRCGRPTPDGYADIHCRDRAAAQLAEIADMIPAARDIAHGLSTTLSGSGGSGHPESRMPLDLTATAKLDGVTKALTKWVDHIGTERGATRPWFTHHGDEIITAAQWLTHHAEWMRHRVDQEPDDDGNTWGAEDFLVDVEAAVRIVRGIVRGPRAQRYLGPCGADLGPSITEPSDGHMHIRLATTCDGDVYGPDGGSSGRCRTCGATVDQAERRAWLGEQAARSDLAWTAKGIADAYGISPKTIRSWATDRYSGDVLVRRARLATYWHNGEKLVPWVELRPGEDVKARGDRLHYVADVVELARKAAADRERRAARRTAEMGA